MDSTIQQTRSRLRTILPSPGSGWPRCGYTLLEIVVVLAIMALPFKLFSDPLAIKGPDRVRWIKREPVGEMWAEMQKQG